MILLNVLKATWETHEFAGCHPRTAKQHNIHDNWAEGVPGRSPCTLMTYINISAQPLNYPAMQSAQNVAGSLAISECRTLSQKWRETSKND